MLKLTRVIRDFMKHEFPLNDFCTKIYFTKRFSSVMDSEPKACSSVFREKTDRYRGVTVDTTAFTLNGKEFEQNLDNALSQWQSNGVRGVWFRIEKEKSEYIPILVKNGFSFHHAKQSYAMLTRWLPDGPNLLPEYPYTHIGVGGLVINDKNEVLVIQEKFQTLTHWKLPGGYSLPGEEFGDTARREILEETGVETEFVSLVTLRHNHRHIFHCSDIYVVCHMKPLTSKITLGEEEVALCTWMNIDEYRTHPHVTDFNRFVANSFLQNQETHTAITAASIPSFNRERNLNVYHISSAKK